MNTKSAVLFLATISISMSGCRDYIYPYDPALGRTNFGNGDRGPQPAPADTDDAGTPDDNPPDDAADTTPPPVTPPTNTVPPPPPVNQPIPFATKAEGKPGFVVSPYAAGKLIDVRGLPPGTEIECPYTKRPIAIP
jgi:hypothetical protein